MTIRPRSRERREDGRAGPDADARLAAAQAPPLVVALAVGEGRVQDGEAIAEPRAEARHRLRREADLGDEDDRPPAPRQRRLDRGQVDLGLARAGDAVQEQLARRAGLAVERGDDLRDRRAPARASSSRPPAAGADLGVARSGAAPASCGSRSGRAPRAGAAPGGRSRPRRPAPAPTSPPPRSASSAARCLTPSRSPPLSASSPAAAISARSSVRERTRWPAGAGPRRQHQLQAARGGRAVLARRSRGRAGPAPPAPRPRAPRSARRGAPAAARRSRRARRRRRASAAGRRGRGPRCRPRDPPSPPAGGSRRARAGRGRWSAARPWRSTPAHGMEGRGRRGYAARRWRSTSVPGEQVIFQGHPSWRAILGFYLKGILVAAIVGVIAKLFGAGSATVFLIVLVDRSASPSSSASSSGSRPPTRSPTAASTSSAASSPARSRRRGSSGSRTSTTASRSTSG